MKVENLYPPNYDKIISIIPSVEDDTNTIFCWGDTIYNPHQKEITHDLEVHESVHTRQQGNHIEDWWNRYLTDVKFRLNQEIEAYGEQYDFICRNIDEHAKRAREQDRVISSARLKKHTLQSIAKALSSSTYGNLLSYGKAESIIKNYGKANKIHS